MKKCTGCLEEMVFPIYDVCMSCTIARHKAVMQHKCSCGRLRRESKVNRIGSRTWINCLRCLGQIKQLS